MSVSEMSFVKTGDARTFEPEPGMKRQVLSYSDQLMLVRHYFEQGWVGARHSHPHHQLVYVVSGAIRVDVAGRVFDAAEMIDLVDSSLDFWLTSEDLPDPDNRVALDREGQIVLS